MQLGFYIVVIVFVLGFDLCLLYSIESHFLVSLFAFLLIAVHFFVFRFAKSIEQKNLTELSHENSTLGSGSFGVCKKMLYRGITVAVKTFQEDANLDLVKWEADVLSLFDHPGTEL